MTAMKRPTQQAHEMVAEVVKPGETVVDATAGNGHDTLFLAGLVGEQGRVVAFDVQEAAIESTRRRLEDAGVLERTELWAESHARMGERIESGVAAVMFNLGYLPGGDHELITRTEETLRALEVAVGLLRPGGVMTVVCYPGHEGGDEEAAAVRDWIERRGSEVFPPIREGAPFLVVERRL
jgi:tRNA A58 N-methylase Trm61